jgi:hypothetical protein
METQPQWHGPMKNELRKEVGTTTNVTMKDAMILASTNAHRATFIFAPIQVDLQIDWSLVSLERTKKSHLEIKIITYFPIYTYM